MRSSGSRTEKLREKGGGGEIAGRGCDRMKVKNQKTIRRLSFRIFGANRTRNLVAVLAIALTAMMFTALFTIAVTLNHSSEQQMMRQVGGYSHGGWQLTGNR